LTEALILRKGCGCVNPVVTALRRLRLTRAVAHRTFVEAAMIRFLSASLFAFALCAACASADDLTTITGKGNISGGTLEKITDASIVVKSGSGSTPTPVADVLDVRLRDLRKAPAAESYFEVYLADDSTVRCSKVVLGKDAKLTLTSGVEVKVPMAAIVTILRDAQDGARKAQFDKMKKTKTRGDRIFRQGEGGLNPIAGDLGEVNEAKQTIKFRPDLEKAEELDVPISNLQGLQFRVTDVKTAPALCKIIDLDGNVLVASKVSYDNGQASVTTPYGEKCTFDGKLLSKLDFNFGRLTYLSDLDAKVTDSILLGGFSPVRKDANLDGEPIMLADKRYTKGLSMYAGAQVEYALSGKYKKLSGLLGVDSRIAEEGQGKVTLKIICDGEERLSQEVSTKAPTPINLNITDVFQLRIIVVGSNFTNYSGHATLANVQVSQ
jgi:NPCBM/NEW2 domain